MSSAEVNIVVNGAEDGARKVSTLRREMSAAGGTGKLVAVQFIGLASATASAYFQFNNLDKIQLRITKQQRLLEEQQAKINKIIKDGGRNTEEYRFEMRQLVEMQERLRQSNEDLQQSQVGFIFSLVSTAAQLPTIIKGFQGLEFATKKWVLIATAAILAFEGIAHLIKIINPEIDITIEKLSGDLFGAINKNMASAQKADNIYSDFSGTLESEFTPAVSSSRSEVDRYSKSIDESTGLVKAWASINKEALADLKKNEDELAKYLNYVDRVRLQTMAGFSQIITNTVNSQEIIDKFWANQRDIGRVGEDPRRAMERDIQRGINLENVIKKAKFKQITGGASPQATTDVVSGFKGPARPQKFAAKVSGLIAARTGFAAGVSGLTRSFGVRRGGGHSKFRMDTPGGRLNFEFEFGSLRELASRGFIPSDFISNIRGSQTVGAVERATAFLNNLLAQEEAARQAEINRIIDLAGRAGFSYSEAVRMIGSGGEQDLFGIADYRQRLMLASAGGIL